MKRGRATQNSIAHRILTRLRSLAGPWFASADTLPKKRLRCHQNLGITGFQAERAYVAAHLLLFISLLGGLRMEATQMKEATCDCIPELLVKGDSTHSTRKIKD